MRPDVAKEYVKAALVAQKRYQRTYPVSKAKITDEKSFVKAAEPILFDVYGREEITEQKPYTVGRADGYWVMWGHLWADHGGVFYIIMEERTGKVIYLTHSL
ncbi:hypothetical protein BC343_17765 [Mucilaginibacter pedocola]|uniref:NTF2 fold domain-containing protein n=2 Tax=Mucilaginibacter pedocola TaxID=1792845 RepID=A0A1S9P848_9SPHI|nr:hypothetical protein BC343_17765 [Mucilaginibacter pedocola]